MVYISTNRTPDMYEPSALAAVALRMFRRCQSIALDEDTARTRASATVKSRQPPTTYCQPVSIYDSIVLQTDYETN